jgi:hypothetical protein
MTTLVNEDDRFYGDVPVKKSAWGFLHKYFFNAQHYFPEVAYNEQARIRYEFPQLIGYISSGAGARNITPISQSLGSQLQNELQYMNQRLILMASYAGFGAFGGGGEIGIEDAKETFGFTPAAMPDGSPSTYTFTVKTHQYLYPAYTVGGTYYNTRNRCKPNTAFTFTMQGSFASSDTGLGICGINYYTDLGSFNNIRIVDEITIRGNRLTSFHSSYKMPVVFNPKNVLIETSSIKTCAVYLYQSPTILDMSKLIRCTRMEFSAVTYNIVFPKSTNLREIINIGPKELSLSDVPNLQTFDMIGKNVQKLIIGNNVGTNTGLSMQSIIQDTYNKQHDLSAPLLQEISIQNVNWTDFDADVLEWYCGIPKCEFKGTISIKEDDSLGRPRITWDLKNKINAKFGCVDNTTHPYHKGLVLDYKRRNFSPDGAKIKGNFYVEAGKIFNFEVVPISQYENTQFSLVWSATNLPKGSSFTSGGGVLTVGNLSNTFNESEIKCAVYRFEDGVQRYDSISKTIEIWNRIHLSTLGCE